MESPCWSRLLTGPVAHGEKPTVQQVRWQDQWPMGGPLPEQSIPEGLHPMERTVLEQFLKSCSPWEGHMLEQFIKDCILCEGPQTGAVEKCEEERVAKMKCYRLTTMPIPHPPVCLRVRR